MKTERLQVARSGDVERAAALLRGGRIVAFPTETVYGLGTRADDQEAVEELYRLKGRPQKKRFTLLIASPKDAHRYAAPGSAAQALVKALWPGPLTLVLPDGRGGDVGLRCPDCRVTLALLRLTGTAIVAPSANLSGQPPAIDAAQVLQIFAGKIAAVLDGGPARIGTGSTVVRVLDGDAQVLREGAIPEAQLRAVLQRAAGA